MTSPTCSQGGAATQREEMTGLRKALMTSRSRRLMVPVLIAVAVLLPLGCARKTATTPAPEAKPAAKESVPLPSWAPQSPSPEFLRAARVLKPIPADMMQNAGEAMQVPAAVLKRYERWWPAGWEFFGTFSDAQTEQVLKTKFLRVHVRNLTPRQRKAFEAFMDAIDSALAGASRPEYRVSLYKFGAKKDLSNVDVGFDIDAHALLIRTWVPTPGAAGKSITTGDAFATL
jgi:hypothetical protein